MNDKQIQEWNRKLTPLSLEARLECVAGDLGPGAAFSTSLGKEDQAIAHAIFTADLPIRVFTLDTGRWFEETHSVLSQTRERYRAVIETYLPDTAALQDFLTRHGSNSFYDSVENRLECCRIRKVEPLQRALRNSTAWITGLRAEQSSNRSGVALVEWDSQHSLVKVNPLADWTSLQLDAYIAANGIPVNRLHAKGYPSIGCAPCTRPVAAGADPRSGRWWWENPNKKECGLHLHPQESA